MTLRAITRSATVGLIVSVTVATALTLLGPPAGALPQPGMTITEDQVVVQEYPPIAGNNPAGEAHTPDVCMVSAYCDLIPIEVIVPDDITTDDEYFVQIEVEWDTRRAPGDPVLSPDGYTLNDMDFYVYTDPPTQEEAESRGHTADTASDPTITDGATGTTPEVAFLFKPKGKYLIVINNYLGANTGYTITLTWFTESIPAPFEKLADEFRPSGSATPLRPTGPVPTAPAPIAAPVASPGGVAFPPLAPVEVVEDADFAAGDFETSGFEDELAAPPRVELDVTPARATPPSGAALFFWLLAVPLAVVALGGTALLRRRATL